MKKVLFFTTVLFVGLLNAQDDTNDKLTIEKGMWNLSSNFSVGFNNTESATLGTTTDNDFFTLSVSPAAGYAIRNNVLIGLGLGYSYQKSDSTFENAVLEIRESEFSGTTFSIYPFIRRYFGLSKNFALFIQGEGRYGRATNEQQVSDGTIRTIETASDNLFFGVRPGLTVFVSKNFALETSFGALGYNWSEVNRDDTDEKTTSNGFSFDLSSTELILGLSYYF
ncbi:hypothetical protein [uncultured Croceitalea sp.]|uniref:hypothetical protein n=1 Tax=uncultured Croceitalea sp. TaxID=1798908 RepID=UPI0033057691